MNKDFFVKNRQNLMSNIENNSIVVVFAGEAPQRSGDQNFLFTPNRNFYYLTGIHRENMILLITKTNDKIEEMMFIDTIEPAMAKWVDKKMTNEEVKEASGVETIRPIDNFKAIFNRIVLSSPFSNLYLDIERRGWDLSHTPANAFAKDVNEKYPFLQVKNIHHMVADLRLTKAPEEIEMMQKAIDITGEGIKALMKNSRAGMMEYQLEAHFDFTIKNLGAKAFAFNTIAASGENATILHYNENKCEIKDGELVLFDLGAEYNYYCADITRTFPINGRFTDRQRVLYNIVLKALEGTIAIMKPGVAYKDLNETTKRILSEECKKIGLIKEDSEISKYYYHGVSHYLGLDTHDVGTRDTVLKPGMVLTVEPGLYIEEEAIGIRIEDDVLITQEGCQVLSKDIIRTVEDIEEFMKK